MGVLAGAFPSWSVTLSDQIISDTNNSLGPAFASYTVANNGTIMNQAGATLETWLSSGSASDWEVRATLSAGSTPTGTLGTWLNCGTSRGWSVSSDNGGGLVASTLTVELRSAGGGGIAASATIIVRANSRDFPSDPGGGGNL